MPSITGVNLPVDKFLIEGKKKIPNLVGTKFTHNNLMEMGACIDLEQHKFEVLHCWFIYGSSGRCGKYI